MNKLIAIFCYAFAMVPAGWVVWFNVPWPEPAMIAVHMFVLTLIGCGYWCRK